jgi:FAD-linked sulfhydryl oxidase
MHIPPEVWGPFFWHTIHIAALGYPQEPSYSEKKAAKEFFESLQFLIPCPICRTHYASHMAKMPITASLDSRKDLFRWTIELHNEVNVMLGKRKYTETEVIHYYTRLGARAKNPVLKPEDFVEADQQAILKGVGAGIVTMGILGTILWLQMKRSE